MKFADASAVSPAGEGTWKAEVQPDWDIFGIANGGYLMAIAARAMSAGSRRSPPGERHRSFHPAGLGRRRQVTVDPVKEGRRFSTLRATLTASSDSISLLGSFAEPQLGGAPSLSMRQPLHRRCRHQRSASAPFPRQTGHCPHRSWPSSRSESTPTTSDPCEASPVAPPGCEDGSDFTRTSRWTPSRCCSPPTPSHRRSSTPTFPSPGPRPWR